LHLRGRIAVIFVARAHFFLHRFRVISATAHVAVSRCTVTIEVVQFTVLVVDGDRFAAVLAAMNANGGIEMSIGAAVPQLG